MKKLLGIIVLGLLLSGCATTPNAGKTEYTNNTTHQYYVSWGWEKIDISEVKTLANKKCALGSEGKAINLKYAQIFDKKDFLARGISPVYLFDCSITKKKLEKETERVEKEKQRSEAIASGDLTFTIKDKKEQCTAIGFAPATEKFADCVLRLVELDVKSQQTAQIALAQSQGNQQVVTQLQKQNNSQSSDAFINLGLKLLNPQSTVSAPSTSTCRVIGSGAYKTVNCW